MVGYRQLSILALAIVCGLLADNAHAQNYPRYAPRGLTEETPQVTIPRASPEEMGIVNGDDRVLLGALDAVVIVDSDTRISQSPELDSLNGVFYNFGDTQSLVFSVGLKGIINKQIGRPVTLRSLNQMARDVILYYRAHKQPIVDVQIPEQRITGGTIHIVVIESRIESVRVQPDCYFDCAEITRWIECTRPGNRIYEPDLESDLLWMNQNPFRTVTVDFQRGSRQGTTDVVYKVNDVRPLRGYVGVDDSGVETLNYGRVFGGLTYGNLFGRGGILGYQFTTDQDFSLLMAHSASYSQPLSRRWSVQSYGSLAGVSPRIGTALTQDGQSWQVGAGLSRHLFRSRRQAANLTFGLDFKSTDNNLEFDGTTISNSNADLVQLRVGYDYHRRGDVQDNYTVFRFDTFIGPGGGLTSAHSAAAFNTIRPGTSPDYFYSRLFVEKSQRVADELQFVGRFTAQTATERILFSETLGLGGYDTIRGIDQRTFNADQGWIANVELGPRTKRWRNQEREHSFRPYAFVDLGNGYLKDPQPGEDDYTFAITTGIGARLQFSDRLSARFDYGFELKSIDDTSRSGRAHVGLTWIPGARP